MLVGNKNLIYTLVLIVTFLLIGCNKDEVDDPKVMQINVDRTELIAVKKIFGAEGLNCSFTDIVHFNNHWFVVFRESDKHVYGLDGKIKIYDSFDGIQWSFLKEFGVEGIDLRDPKFSVNNGELMLYIHGAKFEERSLVARYDFRTVYSKKYGWFELKDVIVGNYNNIQATVKGNECWPWRVTWFENEAYTIGYSSASQIFNVYHGEDGLIFRNTESIAKISNTPTEATIRVNKSGEFFVFTRRNNGTSLIGRSFSQKNLSHGMIPFRL
ncbi:hypothetical protein [Labilibaculum euxinus]